MSVVGFSTAVEIVSAPRESQDQIVRAVCEFGLTKSETKSVRQLMERSEKVPR